MELSQKQKGVLLSYINLIAKNLVTFIYTPILLRMLGQSEYGLYQMANSVISSLTLLNMGFSSAYIRFYAQARNGQDSEKKISELNGLYLILFLFISVLSVILGAILIFNIHGLFHQSLDVNEINTLKYLMVLMILNIAITFPSSVFDSFIIAHEQFGFQRSRQLFQTVFTPIFTLPLLFLGFKSISVVLTQTVIVILFLYLNMSFSFKKLQMKISFKNMNFSVLKAILNFSFFIFLNQVIDQINWSLPNFLLGIYSGTKEVAIFSIATQINNIFITLSTALSGVYVPEINNIVSTTNDNKKLTEIMTSVGKMQMLILSYILAGFVLVGREFIIVWAGAGYTKSYAVALLLILPFIVTLVQNTGYEIIRAKNMHQFRAVVELIFSVISIGISIFFIKKFGVLGATVGSALTMVIVSWFIMNWFYNNRANLDMSYFWKKILVVVPPALIALVFCEILKIKFPVNGIISFITYIIIYTSIYMILLYKISITSSEKRKLFSFLNNLRRKN